MFKSTLFDTYFENDEQMQKAFIDKVVNHVEEYLDHKLSLNLRIVRIDAHMAICDFLEVYDTKITSIQLHQVIKIIESKYNIS